VWSDEMSENCLFCKIGAKEIPAKLVYEDDDAFAFEDISPQAPTHILVCPRKHFAALHDASPEDQALLGKFSLWPQTWQNSGIFCPAIVRSLITAAAPANRSFTSIFICLVEEISAGPQGTEPCLGALPCLSRLWLRFLLATLVREFVQFLLCKGDRMFTVKSKIKTRFAGAVLVVLSPTALLAQQPEKQTPAANAVPGMLT